MLLTKMTEPLRRVLNRISKNYKEFSKIKITRKRYINLLSHYISNFIYFMKIKTDTTDIECRKYKIRHCEKCILKKDYLYTKMINFLTYSNHSHYS